jgi:hypothetical protein
VPPKRVTRRSSQDAPDGSARGPAAPLDGGTTNSESTRRPIARLYGTPATSNSRSGGGGIAGSGAGSSRRSSASLETVPHPPTRHNSSGRPGGDLIHRQSHVQDQRRQSAAFNFERIDV